VTLAIGTNPAAGTITGTTTVNAANGIATFPGITITKVGTGYQLVASSGGLTSPASPVFGVSAAAAAQLIFAVGPPSDVQGNVVMPAVHVDVQDQYGNSASGGTVTVSLEQAPWPRTTLSGTLTASAATGRASFTDLRIDRPGAGYVLRASSGSVSATSNPVAVRLPFTATATGGWNSSSDGLSCGIALGGTYCWGWNGFGQLGSPNADFSETVPFLVATSSVYVEVDGGGKHACGRTASGQVSCWGRGADGQLGNGQDLNRPAPVVVSNSGPGGLVFESVSAGNDHTCGVVTDRSVWCWGLNTWGQLGDGSTSSRNIPIKVSGSGAGALLFTSVSAASASTCGTTAALAVWCWGNGSSGVLGNPSAGSLVPVQVTGSGAGNLRFGRVSASFAHACAVTVSPDPGKVYCWGLNLFGGLGNGVTGGESNVPVLAASSQTFASVAAGTNFTCALTTTQSVYCWGRNFDGELGIGTFANANVPTAVLMPNGVRFSAISSEGMHTCAIANVGTLTGSIYCWGQNADGRLGDGTTTRRSSPVRVVQ
jgi:alpha-tubulin suppressor-like RCC1 family protein